MGDLHPSKKYACQSALVYQSVVLFGHIVRIEEESKKEWFFDALLEKYGNPEWTFEREGYPIMPKLSYLKYK